MSQAPANTQISSNAALTSAAGAVVYLLLGPFPENLVAGFLQFSISTDIAGVTLMSPVWSRSQSADAATHQAGVPIINRSSDVLNTQPAAAIRTAAGGLSTIPIALGQPPGYAPLYILISIDPPNGTNSAWIAAVNAETSASRSRQTTSPSAAGATGAKGSQFGTGAPGAGSAFAGSSDTAS